MKLKRFYFANISQYDSEKRTNPKTEPWGTPSSNPSWPAVVNTTEAGRERGSDVSLQINPEVSFHPCSQPCSFTCSRGDVLQPSHEDLQKFVSGAGEPFIRRHLNLSGRNFVLILKLILHLYLHVYALGRMFSLNTVPLIHSNVSKLTSETEKYSDLKTHADENGDFMCFHGISLTMEDIHMKKMKLKNAFLSTS